MTGTMTPAISPAKRLLTAADLAVMPTSLPTGDVRYELNDGRLEIMPPPGDIHGQVQNDLMGQIWMQGKLQGHGESRTEVGIILRRDPDRVVGADGCFITNASLPVRRSREGYLETIPELVVEIRSKNDTTPEIESKIREYLDAGVKVVWVADPESVTLTEYRPNQTSKVFAADDLLTIADIIPGFSLQVRAAFG